MQPTFVMCRPKMPNPGWDALVEAMRQRGARIELMPAISGLPELTFTASAGLVLDGIALLARFRNVERRAEEAHFGNFFTVLHNRGLVRRVHPMPEEVTFEGSSDCVWDAVRHCLWLGHGLRSDARAASTIARVFDVDVVPIELVSPRFASMDSAFMPLPYGDALVVRAAFSDDGWRVMRGRIGSDNLIAVEGEDATTLAANAVCLGNDILLGRCSVHLELELAARGYRVVRFPLDGFRVAGGSAARLTLQLDRTSSRRATRGRVVREPFGFSVTPA